MECSRFIINRELNICIHVHPDSINNEFKQNQELAYFFIPVIGKKCKIESQTKPKKKKGNQIGKARETKHWSLEKPSSLLILLFQNKKPKNTTRTPLLSLPRTHFSFHSSPSQCLPPLSAVPPNTHY